MSERFNNKYRIKSTRYEGFNYGSDGDYFVTICTQDRWNYFGEVVNRHGIKFVEFSEIGQIANDYWLKIPEYHPFVELDEFTIMPNHMHGIIKIRKMDLYFEKDYNEHRILISDHRKNKFGPQSRNISSILRGYKGAVKSYALKNGIEFYWQPRFHDSIIRDFDALERVRKYIRNNPSNWKK